MSLRLRLVAILGVSLVVLWSAVAVWMFSDVRRELRSSFDERLAASARMVAGLVARLPAEQLRVAGPASLPLDVVARDGLACEVSLVRGEVAIRALARTAASPGLDGLAPGFGTRVFGGRTWRTYVLQQGEVRIATADRVDVREALLREVALSAALPFGVAVAGSLLLLWVGVGRGLRPVERVRRALLDRRADSDAPLPAVAAPPELRPLVDTIGHLLLRVQQTLARERRFTDDAAHELRTPLTAIKTHLQVLGLACGGRMPDERAMQALADAQSGVGRLQRTLDQLLLARLEGAAPAADGAPGCDVPTAARTAIADALAAARHGAAGARRIELQAQPGPAQVAVPEALLVSALRNLLENALRHSPPAAAVVLRIEPLPGGGVEVAVLDHGPGMSAAELAQAARRFWRRGGGEGGSGLGLSIVEAIAKRHGGELLLSRRPGGGLVAALRWPCARHPASDAPAASPGACIA